MPPPDTNGRAPAGVLPGLEAPEHHSAAVRLSDVRPTQVEWLWEGRLPVGKLAVLEGDPGLAKSTITLDLAARISTGRPMPEEMINRQPRGVLLLSGEDDPADTMRPRLEAAGADLDRVVTIPGIPEEGGERPVRLPTDLERVETAVVEHDVALVSTVTEFPDAAVTEFPRSA